MIPASAFQGIVRRVLRTKPSSTSRYTLFLDRVHCIGCADCPKVSPSRFKMLDDGKAAIKRSRLARMQSQTILPKDLDAAKRAIKVCPVNVIWMKDAKTGKKITKRSLKNKQSSVKKGWFT